MPISMSPPRHASLAGSTTPARVASRPRDSLWWTTFVTTSKRAWWTGCARRSWGIPSIPLPRWAPSPEPISATTSTGRSHRAWLTVLEPCSAGSCPTARVFSTRPRCSRTSDPECRPMTRSSSGQSCRSSQWPTSRRLSGSQTPRCTGSVHPSTRVTSTGVSDSRRSGWRPGRAS